MKKMSRKAIFWIVGTLVVLGLAAGGYYYFTTQAAQAESEAAAEAELQTAVARLGELTILASGTGQVTPTSEIGVGFDESGTLIELNVAPGDAVQPGDVLARLQTKNSEEDIAASISDAELNVIRARQSLDDLYTNAELNRTTALNSIAEYAQAVRDAQYTLDNYTLTAEQEKMDAIEALDTMQQRLEQATAAFEPYRYLEITNETRADRLTALTLAQTNFDAAVKRLNYEYALQVAKVNLDNARQEYEQYTAGPAADDLELAQAELANAEAKLALAQEAQSIIELKAPIAGTVMAVDASLGEELSTTAIITLADLEIPTLDVYLDETDLDKAVVGYDAEVVFDALPDQSFTGKVVSVSPGLQSVGNTQAVLLRVQLDPAGVQVNLPVGLNAAVDIVAGRAENAVLVPVEALRDLGDGQYAVFVMENGEPTLRVVEVGLMDVTYAEILSGLQAGEEVTTGIAQTQ
jgi:multidrug efflux pump subunit AcrA (membrane-fusion protein)